MAPHRAGQRKPRAQVRLDDLPHHESLHRADAAADDLDIGFRKLAGEQGARDHAKRDPRHLRADLHRAAPDGRVEPGQRLLERDLHIGGHRRQPGEVERLLKKPPLAQPGRAVVGQQSGTEKLSHAADLDRGLRIILVIVFQDVTQNRGVGHDQHLGHAAEPIDEDASEPVSVAAEHGRGVVEQGGRFAERLKPPDLGHHPGSAPCGTCVEPRRPQSQFQRPPICEP